MIVFVEIRYCEPSYERWHDVRLGPYRWRYKISCVRTENDAIRLALAEFRRIEEMSSVGWGREVIEVVAISGARV